MMGKTYALKALYSNLPRSSTNVKYSLDEFIRDTGAQIRHNLRIIIGVLVTRYGRIEAIHLPMKLIPLITEEYYSPADGEESVVAYFHGVKCIFGMRDDMKVVIYGA